MAGSLDLLRVTARGLQDHLRAGDCSNVDTVERYLNQIKRYDSYLHAMIDLAPRPSLLKQAQQLDLERAEGKVRSKLHGIPVIIKVRFRSAEQRPSHYCRLTL